ncbi:molecular chaperone [Pseudomonas sp. NBRC 100443]|uniref:fimbrial biogenesis chaperone n=1 Tax=Pseudomonas sp. NBRC 100443 TaxID=1113665 RepID=UPI00249F95B6|nr:molecular chaperone [Pseudomonas sp. NBRC 100443]GLU38891.1 chaperone CupA2 [Pseudomonas sp. NBRC 100443]
MSTNLKHLSTALALLGILCLGQAQASVVMTGTRVIYPAAAREKTIQLTNTDAHPNLVQVWLDKGNPKSTVESADAPFVASPQIFRMEPHAGQMVRLVYTGEGLPQDRESVFYLNFSQVPAIKVRDQDANKLVLMFNSRLKVFYRPKGLAGSPDDLAGQLSFQLRDGSLQVTNPTGYHAVVRQASLLLNGKSVPLADSLMVPPHSQTQWRPRTPLGAPGKARLRLTLVNDYGVDVTRELPLLP